MKIRKKTVVILAVVAAVAVVGILFLTGTFRPSAAASGSAVQTKALEKMDIANTVDVTGTVRSTNSQDVYSPLSTMAVKTVNVSVGDKVNQGDILCVLNTDSLEKQIEQSKATLDTSKSTGTQNIKTNQMKYDNDVANVKNGQNTTINQAKASVDSAQTQLSQAEFQYNLDVQAENTALAALDAAKAALAANPSDSTLQADVALAQANYDKAKQAEVAYSSVYNGAQKTYNNAVTAYNAAVNAVNQQIESEKQAINSSKAAANTGAQEASLESLQLQLSQATIKAPVSGTVTKVNAVEGGSSAGLLFTIDDITSLEISTTIKEYDVNSVTLGMPCNIESDGTGTDLYEGTLKSIEPASVQNTSAAGGSGTTQSTSDNDVKFNAVVTVTSQDTRLKIGMNTRVSIVLNKKENVLAVPYDAVTKNTAGQIIVYAVIKGKNNQETIQEIPVDTGMENNFYIEVSGKGLQEGMQIVTNPDSVKNGGNGVKSSSSASASAESGS